MLFRGKRGSADIELWKKLFEVILLASVVIVSFLIVDAAVEDDDFYKIYYSRDNALLIDSLQGIPGEAQLKYNLKEGTGGRFDFAFSKGAVEVSSRDRNTTERSYPFGYIVDEDIFDQEKVLEGPYFFYYERTDDRLAAEEGD